MSSTATQRMHGPVHLVGSMPFDTAEEVLRATAAEIGDLVTALPDGEVGDRRNWVRYLPQRVYSAHPQLEETSHPDADTVLRAGESRALPRWPGLWTFRIREGEELRFDDLHYGRYAIESYGVFRRLRDEGVIPAGVRFQMSLPASGSAINPFFEDVEQWPEAQRAYQTGIRAEIAKVLDVVPAEDLLVQFDLAWEVVDLASGEDNFYPFWPTLTVEEKFARHAASLDELWRGIPDGVLFGYHWCYGTRGGWPMTAMADLGLCVRLSNEAVRRSGRRVDFVHMPVVRHPGPDFFAPLDDLDVGDTRVYLGLVHHTDDVDAFRDRARLARTHRDDFGIASVCGYGRVAPDELAQALRAHRDCAAALGPAAR